MKLLLLTVGLFLAAVHGLPLNQDPEWAMVPYKDSWKLVNVNEDPEPESFYNPETDIVFILFTNDNQNGQIIQWNNADSIRASTFNPNNPTRLTIHGWGGGANDGTNGNIRRALFQVGNFNVITVDWGAGAQSNNYLTARNRVGPTGDVVGRLLQTIVEATGANPQTMIPIGFSLGGHVAGFTGKTMRGLGAVVALDAAGPLFNINNPGQRVADTDADYVESIHTNAGLLGFDEPLGHANFYPNFGRRQPGCGVDASGNCAHGRAVQFMVESITSTVGFWARQCRNYQDIVNGNCVESGEQARMGGEPLTKDSRGVFWMTTNAASPFAQGRM